MKAPEFWHNPAHPLGALLQPLGRCYAGLGVMRRHLVRPTRVSAPVLCVGNLTAGGTGKTPVVIALVAIACKLGLTPHILSRGYGGTIRNTTQVQPNHLASEVGDEPLLLAQHAPCWVGRDRIASAHAAIEAGAELLIMDDGFQNPHLHQDLRFIVIDGGAGFGNGRLLPAGPLRERSKAGFARAHAVVMNGKDTQKLIPTLPDHLHLLRTQPVIEIAEHLKDKPLLAFAGIGRPEKFFTMLRDYGMRLRDSVSFADHYPYSEAELVPLLQRATSQNCQLVTTEKDWMRLDMSWRQQITPIPFHLTLLPEVIVEEMIANLCESYHSQSQ